MTLWPLIETWAALPRKTEAYLTEQRWFDVKGTYGPGSQAEMAKDMAAFANAVGGALIIGATEGITEPDYTTPLSAAWAAKVANEIDEAVRNFCRPSPTVHVRMIPAPDGSGKVMLVVNVEPAVEQPIAARHADDQDAWRFPVRVGRHTEFLFPEQLPLYMNSKARRAKLLLLRALKAGGDVDVFFVPAGNSKQGILTRDHDPAFKLLAVDAEGGGGVLVRDHGAFGSQSIVIPLDDIEAVWLQHDGRWAMRTSGRLEPVIWHDGGNRETVIYTPPTTFVVSPLGSLVEDLVKQAGEVAQALKSTLVVQHFERQEPSDDEIRERAYRQWEMRQTHGLPGSPMSDWLHARMLLLDARRDG
jgi:hypothetical protein